MASKFIITEIMDACVTGRAHIKLFIHIIYHSQKAPNHQSSMNILLGYLYAQFIRNLFVLCDVIQNARYHFLRYLFLNCHDVFYFITNVVIYSPSRVEN
jgi:hypothetical protein